MKTYAGVLSVTLNRKGVLDIDTVKGCEKGMAAHPGGCYGRCYAAKTASFYGYDFSKSVSRRVQAKDVAKIEKAVRNYPAEWFRIGTMGDPCHDWDLTVQVAEWLSRIKIPVIITKHWIPMSKEHWNAFKSMGAVINTSISPLDTDVEIGYRLEMYREMAADGIKSVLRIVSAKFGMTPWGCERNEVQQYLFGQRDTIDNPLRIPMTDERVKRGDIIVERHKDLGGGSTVSIAWPTAYLGRCPECPDQCGVNFFK